MARCGLDTDTYRDELDFSYIREFSTLDSLSVLGEATSSMCEPVLREICQVVEDIDRENDRRVERKSGEKDKNILANDAQENYNTLKHESDTQDRKEGGTDYGTDISSGRGLSDSEHRSERGAGGEPDEVRNASGDISEGTSRGDLHREASVGNADGTLSDDTETGRGEVRETEKPDDGERGSDGGAKEQRSDGVGSSDELDNEQSGRDRSVGDRLQSVVEVEYKQLSIFPYLDEQMGTIAAAEAGMKSITPAAFSLKESDIEDILRRVLPADPNVKNFSYTVVDNEVYYRENSVMKPVELPESKAERIKGLVAIRDVTRTLIDLQMEETGDGDIAAKMKELNDCYDDFEKKFGRINSRTNKSVFSQDASYSLLCSLEKFDSDGNFKEKADMFTKRTIKRAEVVTSVDTASEALAVSLSEKARVDITYMMELTGKSDTEITDDLVGVIFKEPISEEWQTADEYLSGNVRDKLAVAKSAAESSPEYEVNAKALEAVMPKDLEASEIEVRIGATWIKSEYVDQFMREIFKTPEYLTRSYGLGGATVGVQYSAVTGVWNVKGKNADRANPIANSTYGTMRANAYKILEDSLNLKDSRVYDTVLEEGKEKRVLNKKETTLASQKQETIREAFKDWIFAAPERRADLVETYNKLFNSIRPREYEGAHLTFPGMSPEVTLRPHQKNAVAHQLYGDNTLLVARSVAVFSEDGKEKEPFEIRIGKRVFTDRKEAGTALIEMCRNVHSISTPVKVGDYMGFSLAVTFEPFQKTFDLNIKGAISHHIDVGADAVGNMTRIANAMSGMETKLAKVEDQLSAVKEQLESAEEEVKKPFEKEQELAEKLDRLNELNALLNMDEKGDSEKEEDLDSKEVENIEGDGYGEVPRDSEGNTISTSEAPVHDGMARGSSEEEKAEKKLCEEGECKHEKGEKSIFTRIADKKQQAGERTGIPGHTQIKGKGDER